MKPDNKAGGPWLYALGLVPVIWFALLIAPAISGGLSEIVSALPAAMNNPFKIVWCEDSVKTVLIFIAAYGQQKRAALQQAAKQLDANLPISSVFHHAQKIPVYVYC